MKTLLWAELSKLRRSNIIWIAIFSAIMVSVIVFMMGQFMFNGHRYVDGKGWLLIATQSLGSLYVLPAIIALTGCYLICRENQDDTMKSLLLIPVKPSKLIISKLIVSALLSVLLYTFLFIITFITESILHFSLFKPIDILHFLRIYLLQGICIFIAVSPIIAIVSVLRKSYWLALLFTEVYSFSGLFASMQSSLRSIYPITAAFCVSGYYKTTFQQFMISLASLLLCAVLTLFILRKLNNRYIL